MERAVEMLRAELAGGEWHESAPIIERLKAAGLASGSVLADARSSVRLERRKRPGVTNGPWEWRIATDSCPDDEPDGFLDSSIVARARCISETDSSIENDEIPYRYGKSPTIRTVDRTDGSGAKNPSPDALRARTREDPSLLDDATDETTPTDAEDAFVADVTAGYARKATRKATRRNS
ncbi:MAG: hypothetical protein ACLP01_08080 [Solirubrobacteraceae bacterium]